MICSPAAVISWRGAADCGPAAAPHVGGGQLMRIIISEREGIQ